MCTHDSVLREGRFSTCRPSHHSGTLTNNVPFHYPSEVIRLSFLNRCTIGPFSEAKEEVLEFP